jgi:hypothetical protein
MRATFGLVLCLAGGMALAQDNPISGVYGDEGGCRRLAGQPEGTDLVFILTPDRIERWESACDITSIATEDGNPAQIDVTCSGEGETWTDSYAVSPLSGEDGYSIGPVDFPEIRFDLRPCG